MKSSHHHEQSKVEFCQNSTYRNRLTSLLNALMASVAILAVSATCARAAGNSLTNASFELGPGHGNGAAMIGWRGINNYAIINTNDTYYNGGSGGAHVLTHSGTNVVKLWGMFWNGWSVCEVYQDVPTGPTTTWAADCWAMTHAQDFMAVGNQCWLEVTFRDLGSNILGSTYKSGILSNNAAPSTWIHLQVTDGVGGTNLAAPSGTAFARCRLAFMQPPGYPGGSASLDDVNLTKTSAPDPELTVQPQAQTIVYGQTVTFSCTANGRTSLTYKWQKDGSDITDPNAYGVTTSTLILSNVTTAMMGNYTVTVTDQAGPLTSDPAYLTVNDPGVLSMTPPLGQTIISGGTASFKVSAAGSASLTYSWRLNGNLLSDSGHFSGTTTSNLTVANLTATEAGTYIVLIDGGAAQASSGLKVVPAAQLATNLLVNPGFEDGVWSMPWERAWGFFNGVALDTANDFYDVLNQQGPVSVWDGIYVGAVYSRDIDNGINQTVPITAGVTYHAGGMFYVSHFSPVNGDVKIWLQFHFSDAGGNTMTAYGAHVIDTNFVTDTWTALQVTNGISADLVAPAGAVSATVQVYEYNYNYQGGAVTIDNLYLTPASLPAPTPVKIAASAVGGMMNLSFPSASGVTYEVLYTSSLSPATWHTNTTIMGDGGVKAISDPIGATNRFYRILEHN